MNPQQAPHREGLAIRGAHFPKRITFHAPGLRRYKTADYTQHDAAEFASISITGTACALACDHCKTNVLRGMTDLTRAQGSASTRTPQRLQHTRRGR